MEIGKLKLKADLIPPALIVRRYFVAEQRALDDLRAEQESMAQQLDEMKEEQSGEDGLLEEVKDEKGKISKDALTRRLKEINQDAQAVEEQKTLEFYLALTEAESAAGKRVRVAQKALVEQVVAKYGRLSEAEVKALVVHDKWLATLTAEVTGELERVSQALTGRFKELAERYAVPLPQIMQELESLSARVDAHLRKMGLVWN